jgi:Flp pilus assembly protein TadD
MRCLVSFVLVLSGFGPLGYGAEAPDWGALPSRADAEHLTILGDKLYRNGRFGDAQAAYERALALDGRSIPARLGLGRIADLLSEADLARTHYAKAFETNPAHPGAVLAFASVVTGEARETLLGNFLALNRPSTTTSAILTLKLALKLSENWQGAVWPRWSILIGHITCRSRSSGRTPYPRG